MMKVSSKILVSQLVALLALNVMAPCYAGSSSPAVEKRLAEIEAYLNEHQTPAPQLLDEVSKIIESNPTNGKAHFLAGRILQRNGFSLLADQEFAKAEKYEPRTADAMLESFLLKLEQGDPEQAFDTVRYIAKRFPDDPSLALTRALLLEAKGKKEIAEVFLTKALEGQDKRMGIATAVGDVRLRQGLPLEALRLAKRDLAKNPNYFRANVVAGEACTKLKRYKEGATYLRKAYELNPLDERFVNNYATDLYRSGQYVEALEPSLIFLATATKPDLLHKAKYQLQLLMKRTTEAQLITAVRSADKKLDHTLYQGRLHLALGDVFDKQGKRKLAEECYARGIELLPDIGRAYYRLARDFEKDKNYRQAYQLYQKAYSLEPKDNQVAAGYFRFGERYSNRDNDLAWKLKDMIRKQ